MPPALARARPVAPGEGRGGRRVAEPAGRPVAGRGAGGWPRRRRAVAHRWVRPPLLSPCRERGPEPAEGEAPALPAFRSRLLPSYRTAAPSVLASVAAWVVPRSSAAAERSASGRTDPGLGHWSVAEPPAALAGWAWSPALAPPPARASAHAQAGAPPPAVVPAAWEWARSGLWARSEGRRGRGRTREPAPNRHPAATPRTPRRRRGQWRWWRAAPRCRCHGHPR